MPKPTEIASQLTRAARQAAATVLGQRGIFRTLKGEHGEVSTLIMRCERTDQGGRGIATRRELFQKIRAELLAHAKGEEKEFYSVLEQNELTRDQAKRNIHQHEEIEKLLQELSMLNIESPEWMERFGQLRREVMQHVEEEEQKLFPLAKRVLSPERLREIDRRFRAEKKRQLRELERPLH